MLEILGAAIVGGMEISVRNLVQRLPADQFQAVFVCPFETTYTRALRDMGYQVYVTPIEDDPRWRSIQLVVEVIRLHRIDLIHAHMPKAHVLAGLAGRLTNTPVVATIHGMHVTAQELGICRVTGSHLITVCQEGFAQALSLGIPAERVNLIPNGVDTEHFKPGRSGTAFRDAVGIPQDAPLVGFVGRLDFEKGPDVFVRLAGYVHERRPDAHFVMVGDGLLANEARDLADRLGLGDHLHLPGVWDNPAEVYAALDVLASTSRNEGMPLVLLEAMACGVPCVAMAVGGVPEVIEHNHSGLLIMGKEDWAGAGFCVWELLDQPERRQRMGQAARRRAEDIFDLESTASRTADLFRQLAGVPAAHANGHAGGLVAS